MYLKQNNFTTIKVDSSKAMNLSETLKIKIGKEFDDKNIIVSSKISDHVQGVIVIPNYNLQATVGNGFAEIIIPSTLIGILQKSTYLIEAVLQYNNKTIKKISIVLKVKE